METKIHVVMVPWLAFGHLMPFFQLSIALARARVRVSFISTPNIIQRLPKLPPDIATFVELVEFPLHAKDQSFLPEGAEATVDIPFEQIQYLKVAYDHLQVPIKQFIANHLPDWIISDCTPHWVVDIAEEYNIPIICYYVFSAAATVFFGPPEYLAGDGQQRLRSTPESLTHLPEWVSFPSKVAYRSFEATGTYAGFWGKNASGLTDAERLAKLVGACKAVAVRTCFELERNYLETQAKVTGKPGIPVGLLPPELPPRREIVNDESWSIIFKWLEKQEPKTVVFVGFGSECKLSRDQVYEIAYGLELAELCFLWALQKPNWANNDLDALPSGFSQRISGKGMVHIGWAPQKEILAHPSVGGSLFHSGWGSIIETLQYGHSCVVLPFIIDQPLNARWLEEKGLGIEVERSEDGSFSRKDIAKALKFAMVSEEGELLRCKAREAAAIFGDMKRHDLYIQRFVQYLKDGVSKQRLDVASLH